MTLKNEIAPRTRRRLLGDLATAGAFLIAHDRLVEAWAAPAAAPDPAGRPLIAGVRLLTAAPLEEMQRFYAEKLGLRLIDRQAAEISFAAGSSRLTFVKARPEQIRDDGGRGDGAPFYHFAFNIPQNKIRAARDWQARRTALVPTPSHMQDSAFPPDVRHFRSWNSHAVFFFDPAFNIVEYIARHDLRNDRPDATSFSSEDLLFLSEIGFVVDFDEQGPVVEALEKSIGLAAYPRGSSPRWAMGDENGLLLCLGRKGELWGENTATPVKWDVFPTEATINRPLARPLDLPGLPYRVLGSV